MRVFGVWRPGSSAPCVFGAAGGEAGGVRRAAARPGRDGLSRPCIVSLKPISDAQMGFRGPAADFDLIGVGIAARNCVEYRAVSDCD